MKQLTNTELVAYLLGPRVIECGGVHYMTDPHAYFAITYAQIMANAQGPQQEEALVTSTKTIEVLVQNGLKPTDGLLPRAQAGIVLGATYHLIDLVGSINGVDQLAMTYMGFLVPNPTVPTREDLDMLSEDLFLP